jgi:TonB-linked SusC/RagA family outer membrane protein
MKKFLSKWKLLAVLCLYLSSLCQVYAQTLASSAKDFPDLSIQDGKQTKMLKDVLSDMEGRYKVSFSYDRTTVEDKEVRPGKKAFYQSVEDELSSLLKPLSLEYERLNDKVYLILPSTEKAGKALKKTGLLPAEKRSQNISITGVVKDENGGVLPGVTVLLKTTTTGTTTNGDGKYTLTVPDGNGILIFSYIGYATEEVPINKRSTIDVSLVPDIKALSEVVVVGYGTQKRSDLTGSVASIPAQRLEQVPNNNFAQALQGSVPGVNITTNSAGAEQNDVSILIRGRNSITASNNPLIVWDGVPYSGSISDINPTDIESIEVLKDASATAIYGSRGSNGVILITSKRGREGKPTITYDGSYGIQQMANLPDWLNGEEFYLFKEARQASSLTPSEKEIYANGSWVNWMDLATRTGQRHQHTLSVAGGTENTKYYISAALMDVKGIAINDDFSRYSTRINLETAVTKWLKLGTNTQLSLSNRSGEGPSWGSIFLTNPLTKAYEEDGSLSIYPWPEYIINDNPLSPTLHNNEDKTYKVFTNNYLDISFPFLPGLTYRLNTGVEFTNRDWATYQGRNVRVGLENGGIANTENNVRNNVIIENIVSYQRQFNRHNLYITGLYSYQQDRSRMQGISSRGFPNDILTWHQAQVGKLVQPRSNFSEEDLISQMLRINYGYDSRYLLTLTGRRDGYSGFGSETKYGIFPTIALGWNIFNEAFMKNIRQLNELKLRVSYGQNGNQAVGPYRTLSRMREEPYLNGTATAPGYVPSRLGNPNLGWETTTSFNVGLDYALLNNRIKGTLDYFNAHTEGLLLERQISSVHGISTITQNIGKTNNRGIELGLTSYNIQGKEFTWFTNANFSMVKNKIVDLYGNGKDDVLNRWFVGQPIRVNYGLVFDGVWQLNDDYDNAHQQNAEPGFLKIKDVNGDNTITDQDRIVQGQIDPVYIWGLNNTLSYKNFTLYFLFQGMHGHQRFNPLRADDVGDDIVRNTLKQNWWTPDNPTNEHFANHRRANSQLVGIIEDLGFVRFKDISLSYDISSNLLSKIGMRRTKIYVSGRNMATFTRWTGLDPELNDQLNVPLQKEYVVGLTFGL